MLYPIPQATEKALQLGEIYQLGVFIRGYREPGHLLFFGSTIAGCACGMLLLFGPAAIFGGICIAFSLLALIAGLGGLYLGRRQLYLYNEGFVLAYTDGLSETRMRKLTHGVRWRDVVNVEQQTSSLSRKNKSYTHVALYKQDDQERRLLLTQEEAALVGRAYREYTLDIFLGAAVERLDAGETLDFGVIRVTKDNVYIRGRASVIYQDNPYAMDTQIESSITLAWDTISRICMEDDAPISEEENRSEMAISIYLQPGANLRQVSISLDDVTNASTLLILASLFVDTDK